MYDVGVKIGENMVLAFTWKVVSSSIGQVTNKNIISLYAFFHVWFTYYTMTCCEL